jgi:chromosome transmission fidelity protein 8
MARKPARPHNFEQATVCDMRIPIVPVSNQPEEFALIELQGAIIPKTQSFQGQRIGPLTIEGANTILVIGNHQLHGRVEKLRKPLLVLRRGDERAIEAVGCVRSKAVFSDRPRLIFD